VLPDARALAKVLQRFEDFHQHCTMQKGAVFKQALHLWATNSKGCQI
jgi:hypothetical protein